MTEITTYTGSNGRTQQIADMPYTYMGNIVRNIEAGTKPDDPPGTLAAIKAEMARRPPPEDAQPAQQTVGKVAPTREGPAGIGDNKPPPFEVVLAEKHADLAKRVAEAIAAATAITEVKTEADYAKVVEAGNALAKIEKEVENNHASEKAEYKVITDAIDHFFLTRGLKGKLTGPRTAASRLAGEYLAEVERLRRKALQEEADAAREQSEKRLEEAAAAEAAGRHTEAEVAQAGALAHEVHADTIEQRAQAPAAVLGRVSVGTGSGTLKKTVEIQSIDRAKLDIATILPFIDDEALEKAIRAVVKVRGWKGSELIGDRPTKTIAGVVFYEKHGAAFR